MAHVFHCVVISVFVVVPIVVVMVLVMVFVHVKCGVVTVIWMYISILRVVFGGMGCVIIVSIFLSSPLVKLKVFWR